jgi:hypothetical protein
LLIEPVDFRYNVETSDSNVFQHRLDSGVASELGRTAILQHRALRDLLIENGVRVTVARSRAQTPDAAFCNNWFSTHLGPSGRPDTLVLYPLLAPNRRIERRPDLVGFLRAWYPRVVDFSSWEGRGVFLESTGSLCLDEEAKVAYGALSPRTDEALAVEWAAALGYRLVTFTATDAAGVPYYHTNVMMFIGHGLAGVCLESLGADRARVESSLRDSGLEVIEITREQVLQFCGNCLALENDRGEPLLVMSTAAWNAFGGDQREAMTRRTRVLHVDLSAFEQIGGGSARCLLGELV